jgi:3-oxoacyl-[acyl-carrier protein] reductase
MDPAWHDEQVARTPLGRLATPEEIADAAAAAVTAMTGATGCVLLVDAGRSLS